MNLKINGEKMDTYVVMKQIISPICNYDPEPCFVAFSREEAKRVCNDLSTKAKKNIYWFKKCKNDG